MKTMYKWLLPILSLSLSGPVLSAPWQDGARYFELQTKRFDINDNNTTMVGGSIGNLSATVENLSAFFFINTQNNDYKDNFDAEDHVYLSLYSGISFGQLIPISRQLSIAGRLQLGLGLVEVTERNGDTSGTCECMATVIEPVAEFSYQTTTSSAIGAQLSYLKLLGLDVDTNNIITVGLFFRLAL